MNNPADFATLQQQVAQLMAAQQRGGSPAVRPPKPSTFDGSRRSQVDSWLYQVQTYLRLSNLTGTTAIDHASAFLRDHAATWWRTHCLSAAEPDSNIQLPTTWDEFERVFRQRFQPLTSKEVAREQIYSLSQRTSVTDYVNRFNEVTCHIDDMAPAEKLSLFLRGLKDPIKRELKKNPPADYNAAVLNAERLDAVTWRGRSIYPSTPTPPVSNPYPYQYPSNRASSSRPSAGPTPMELGALTHSSRPIQPSQPRTPHPSLTPAEKQRRRDRGLCMYCGEPGHTREYCPHKPRNSSRPHPNGQRPLGSRR